MVVFTKNKKIIDAVEIFQDKISVPGSRVTYIITARSTVGIPYILFESYDQETVDLEYQKYIRRFVPNVD